MSNPYKIRLFLLAGIVVHCSVIAADLSPGSTVVGADGPAVGEVAGVAPASGTLSPNLSEEELRKIADDLNKSLPMTSRYIRAERVVVGPGAQLTYVYTILVAASKVLSEPELRANGIALLKALCATGAEHEILNLHVTQNLVFNSYDGKLITKIRGGPVCLDRIC